jgi:hypothetical protein
MVSMLIYLGMLDDAAALECRMSIGHPLPVPRVYELSFQLPKTLAFLPQAAVCGQCAQ